MTNSMHSMSSIRLSLFESHYLYCGRYHIAGHHVSSYGRLLHQVLHETERKVTLNYIPFTFLLFVSRDFVFLFCPLAISS